MIDRSSLVTIRNLCSWPISFALQNTVGDIFINGNGTKDLFVSEIFSQINNNNIFFVGTDGKGAHAKAYIENDELRKELMFDTEKEKQNILTDEKCEYILNLKTTTAFEKNVKDSVVLNHEKDKIMRYARKVKLNDFDKIDFLQTYCGMKFKEEN